MRLYEIAYACSVYRIFRNYDNAYNNFLEKTKPSLNMLKTEHINELLNWLRDWGCRQFHLSYSEQASKNLRSWYEENENLLPPLTCSLLELLPSELENTTTAYERLTQVKASNGITVGPTGASKILFALRKDIYPPWDREMRRSWNYNGTANEYKDFLLKTEKTLNQISDECLKHGFTIKELPRKLGMEHYSLIKLLDECNIVYVTNKLKKLDIETIEGWYSWSKS